MAAATLEARLHRRAIDRDLASGIAGWRSPAHAARVEQLTSAKQRRRLAATIDHLLWAATAPASQRVAGAIPPCRASIEATAAQFRGLATRLRSDAPVAAAGVLRLQALLADGAGPIYAPGCLDALDGALVMAQRWLDIEE
jgi:hypothetical protein